MKHPERVQDYLEHIAQAINRAIEYLRELDSAQILQETPWAQDAVARNIEIIGEAASRIQKQAPEFAIAHPELPWVEMRGMRNKMIHNYFDVDLGIVWRTVTEDLPRLKLQIGILLNEYRRDCEQEQNPEHER